MWSLQRANPSVKRAVGGFPPSNSLRRHFAILHNERVTIIGKTGCGKTTLAELLLNNQPGHVICLDPKWSCAWKGWRIITKLEDLWKAGRGQRKNEKVIFRPPHRWTFEDYDQLFFGRILQRENTLLYIDEIYACAKETTQPYSNLGALATRGRQLNIGLWVSTQRPTRIPLFLLSEAEHFFQFHLRMPNDIKRAWEVIEDDTVQLSTKALKRRFFYYINSESDLMVGPLTLNIPAKRKEKSNG